MKRLGLWSHGPWFGTTTSIRGQLTVVVLVTTAIALLTMTAALLHRDFTDYRRSLSSDLSTEAGIVAMLTAPAMAFDDERVAERNLAALSARPEVLAASLYDARGALYASYRRDGTEQAPATLDMPREGMRIVGGRIEITRSVRQNGERLGTIHVRAVYDPWGKVGGYVGVLGAIMLLSLSVALILAARLRRRIVDPVEKLAAVADGIVSGRDATLRAEDSPLEEFSRVVKAFNSVLDESEERTRALRNSNIAMTREMHDRAMAEAALALANARLDSALAAAQIGSWFWNLQTHEVTIDRNLAALLGLEPAPVIGDLSLLHQQIHPEDLPRVQAAEQAALRTGHLQSIEYRLLLPDGKTRWVVSRGTLHNDQTHGPAMLLGLLIDITAQRSAERAMRQSEKLYRAIGESIDYGVWVSNAEGRNIYASDSFLRLLGISQSQCSDVGWTQALHPDDVADTLASWQDCVRSGDIWYREHRFRGADGRYHPILAQGVPMRDEEGNITGWAGINLDISRIKKTEDALREADRRKDDFLATLAHELRNPLAPIRHAARVLGQQGLDPAQMQTARDIISRQVARMALLLDDLLEVSRITRGRLELRRERVPLATLVKAAVETSRPLIEAKNHRFTIQMPDILLDLEVDSLRISQALSNLLTNAAKYTDDGGVIELSVHCHPGEVTFTVRDTGIGLPPTVIPTIFEMFSQVDSPIDRSEGGLGIGLALVKGLITLHGGTVEAASEGIGRGSTFTIRIPGDCIRQPTRDQPDPERPVSTGRCCSILLVDDNLDAAGSLAMLLRHSGHSVLTADRGRLALELAAQSLPDVVILDIGMPDMNGYEVARQIRQMRWDKPLLLLALTGWGQKEDVDRALAAGFDRHMTKPADPARIEQLIDEFLAAHQVADQPCEEN